jgi:hypothetical protein
MTEPKIYLPKAVAFQRAARLASSASRPIDNGVPLNEAHVVALLEYFEFLAPEQFTSIMGPGLAAECSAVTEHEFPLGLLKERAPLLQLLLDHTSMFAGAFLHDGEDDPRCYREWKRVRQESLPSGRFSGYACLVSNITMAMTLGQRPRSLTPRSNCQAPHLRRTAEIFSQPAMSQKNICGRFSSTGTRFRPASGNTSVCVVEAGPGRSDEAVWQD